MCIYMTRERERERDFDFQSMNVIFWNYLPLVNIWNFSWQRDLFMTAGAIYLEHFVQKYKRVY